MTEAIIRHTMQNNKDFAISKMTMLFSAIVKQDVDMFDDGLVQDLFQKEADEIEEILGLSEGSITDTILEMIDSDSERIPEFLWAFSRYGVLAEVSVPVRTMFTRDNKGTIRSGLYSWGFFHNKLIYATTIQELLKKAVDTANHLYQQDLKEWEQKNKEVKQ